MMEITVIKSADLCAFLKLLRSAEENERIASAEMSDIDKSKEDVLHYIELENPEDAERAEAISVLHDILQIRREIKDAFELIKPVSKWVRDNQPAIKSLERLLGELRNIEDRLEKRFYSPRTELFDELKKKSAETTEQN